MRAFRPSMPMLLAVLGLLTGLPATADEALDSAPVAQVDLPRVYRLDGVAEAVSRSTVSAQTSGRVVEIGFDVDDYVRAGDLIVRLDDSQQRAAVAQAEANLRSASAQRLDADNEYTRIKGVFDKGAVSQSDMDKVSAARKRARAGEHAAEAAVQQAREELDYTEIRAPYNGIVTERLIEVGETAQPGRALMSGLSLDKMRISVDVPQNLVESIRRQRKAQAQIAGQWVLADDVTVFPVADPRSDTFKVRLELPDGTDGVFPGMYIKVGFVSGVDRGLVIPLSAVVVRSEVVGVYVIAADGEVRFRHIRTGSAAGPEHVRVLSGLSEGELVATDPVRATIALKSQRSKQAGNE